MSSLLKVCSNSVIRQRLTRMAAVNNHGHVQTQPKRKSCVAPETKQLHVNTTKNCISEKNKHPSFLQNVSYCFAEYLENTSIHGLKFLPEKRRPWIEKLCWFVFLVVSLYTCITLIWRIYKKWINLPVIITFATSQTSIFDIPFPAVTICPTIKADRNLFNHTSMYLRMISNLNLTANESKQFEYMSLVCPNKSPLLNFHKTVVEPEAIDYLIEVAPHLENYLSYVQWKGKDMTANHMDLFSPILTSSGLCYTFNMLNRSEIFKDIVKYPPDCFTINGKTSEWLPEKGYKLDADTEVYPRRTSVAGSNGGLKATFYFLKDQVDYACSGSVQGYKVSLHDPAELPSMEQHYFYLPFDQAVLVAVKPNIMTTSVELDDYTPQDRNCYFSHERSLKYFKRYNQQNCVTECLTNFTLAMCKCVNFYMPKEKFIPTCGVANKECVDSAKELLFAKKYNNQKQTNLLKLTDRSFHVTNINYTENCDCLPACFSMNFDIETSGIDIKLKETFLALSEGIEELQEDRIVFEKEMVHATELNIFFKGVEFVPSERNQLCTYTDFWANVGGIIGLFTGFSFISMFEIVYYLTLRTSCNARMFGRRYWSGAPDLLKMKEAASK